MKDFMNYSNKKAHWGLPWRQPVYPPLIMLKARFMTVAFVLAVVLASLQSCNKLDKDGGYYDEETKTYKYVNITKKGVKKSSLQVFSPVPGRDQQVYGIVSRIEDDAKSFWLKIEDRHPYMIIAERLSGGNRNDKEKEIRIQLKYVSPMGSVTKGGSFKKKWKKFVLSRLSEQLVNQSILVDIEYQDKARKLWGTAFKVVKTQEGDRARNINLWMIQQGLSFYFIDQGKAADDKKYNTAQRLAGKYKNGIWKYQ
jgi:endonuclease YncB( thermonuclease family)